MAVKEVRDVSNAASAPLRHLTARRRNAHFYRPPNGLAISRGGQPARPLAALPGWAAPASTRIVDPLRDRRSDDGPLEPALQPLRVLLRQDALARGVRHYEAANPEHSENVARSRLDTAVG